VKAINSYKVIGIIFCFCAVMAINSPAQTLTTLVTFNGTNGSDPAASLIQGSDGNLYGTTEYGGGASNCESGYPCGTVFKITPSGTLTRLHSFDYGDGAYPVSPLVRGSDGNFYGTNQGEADSGGAGTIFKITPSGTLTVLRYSFSSPAGLVQGRDGNFYGTTPRSYTHGTVFKITPGGTLTTLHTFNGTDGDNPQAGLIQATDGNFYGTTASGGTSNNCGGGCGTVFKITSGGVLTRLHSFSVTDGFNVVAGLVQGSDGNFYGTTAGGGTGACGNGGTVFKITPSGSLTTLYNFGNQPSCASGYQPRAGLVQGRDGNFYGTTSGGGAHNQGAVFAITPGGTLTTLYSFCAQTGCADGTTPVAALIQASDGNFYGTTYNGGGNNNSGTVFKLKVSYSTLTVTTSGNGVVTSTDSFIHCPGTCSHNYIDNSQVTLNATPASGWAFSGWGGACSGTGSCDLTMTRNTTISASFYQLPVTLTVSVAGSGTVTSTDGYIHCPGTCQHVYNPNTPLTLHANPVSGWMFSGWTGACSGVGACNITMTNNFALTGVFFESGHGLQFNTAKPCRLVDTRTNKNPIRGGTYRNFDIPQLGGCNIPTAALAYSLNVAVVPHGPLGYLTVWPAGEAQPLVATLNSSDGRIKANAAIVSAGSNHSVSVYATDTTDLVIDIDGYFTAPSSQSLQFYPMVPCRVVDTRGDLSLPQGLGPPSFETGESRRLPILLSSCFAHLPNQPLAYSFNVAVVPKPARQPLNYLTIWPSDQAQPDVATLNNPTATVVANAAIVPAAVATGEVGEVSVYTYNSTDVIIDTNGYFAAPETGGYSFYPTAPCRVLDTRNNNGSPFSGTLNPPVNVPGSPCGPPLAEAYVFNATVVPEASMGYLTLWPVGESRPGVATLNAYDGFITSNMAIVPSLDGSINAYADGTTWLILDLSGYFAP